MGITPRESHRGRAEHPAAQASPTLRAWFDSRRTGAVLREEPRTSAGRRAGRDHPRPRLRQERRPDDVPVRPAERGWRPAPTERRDQPGQAAHDRRRRLPPRRARPGEAHTPTVRRRLARLPALRGRRCAWLSEASTLPDPWPSTRSRVQVRDRLREAGIDVECQLGVAGYFIDFAAKHPTKPGRMVLAIEARRRHLPRGADHPVARPASPGAAGAPGLALPPDLVDGLVPRSRPGDDADPGRVRGGGRTPPTAPTIRQSPRPPESAAVDDDEDGFRPPASGGYALAIR